MMLVYLATPVGIGVTWTVVISMIINIGSYRRRVLQMNPFIGTVLPVLMMKSRIPHSEHSPHTVSKPAQLYIVTCIQYL